MRHALWIALVVLVAATVVAADDDSSAPASFSLDLARCDLAAPGDFHLLPGDLLAEADAAPVGTVATDPSPAAPALALTLAWTPADDRVPDGLRMSFKQRTWDDLDGWEKTGYVLAQTSAAAGFAYLLYRLVD